MLPEPIEITVNGESALVPDGQSVAMLLAVLDMRADRVAVEVDKRLVPRCEWAATALREGAQVEIVQFVGGG